VTHSHLQPRTLRVRYGRTRTPILRAMRAATRAAASPKSRLALRAPYVLPPPADLN
jgi:hypothetical protein